MNYLCPKVDAQSCSRVELTFSLCRGSINWWQAVQFMPYITERCSDMNARDSLAEATRRRSSQHPKNMDSTSLASKIAESTSGLACSVMGRPGATELSRSTTLGNKASNASSYRSTSWLEDIPVLYESRTTRTLPDAPYDSFRSTPIKEGPNPEFEEFSTMEAEFSSRFSNIDHRWDANLQVSHLENVATPEPESFTSSTLSSATSLPRDASLWSSEWTDVPKNRDRTFERFGRFREGQEKQNTIHDLAKQNHHAHNRLKLVLGHLSRTLPYASSYQKPLSLTRDRFDTMHQTAIAKALTLPGHLRHQNVSGYDCKTAARTRSSQDQQVQHDRSTYHEKHVYERHTDVLHQSQNQEPSLSTEFHCPWAHCRQRPKTLEKLQSSANAHMAYFCSHNGCSVHFHCYKDWAEHIAEPHQDLDDESKSGGSVASESWFSPRLHLRRRW
ncbi:hypothetical protein BDV96DRAFT_238993 [Lophiotrema nucula]|uniref:Uncharacterized protein n=1 Tax=Lophiotrema nucula TaxID=690887 RepID=A0A6A5YS39_9PLEO|nr:hypothetical protein BDV96DRAFT_238993 [Lophiotrema nucula]